MKTEEARFFMVKERHSKSLEKAQKERKADEKAMPIAELLKKSRSFFTTSSCSGRIILMDLDKEEGKKEGAFHAKWHRIVEFNELWKEIEKENKENLWFKQEPFVFLIGANSLENAEKVLKACRKAGVKRAGINFFEKGKVFVEVIGTQNMSVMVKEGSKILIEKKYMEKLLEYANRKLEKNFKVLKEFEKELRKAAD